MRTVTQHFYTTPDFALGKFSTVFTKPHFPNYPWTVVCYNKVLLFSQETKIAKVNSGTYLLWMTREKSVVTWMHHQRKKRPWKIFKWERLLLQKVRLVPLPQKLIRISKVRVKILLLFSHSFWSCHGHKRRYFTKTYKVQTTRRQLTAITSSCSEVLC